MVGHHPAKFVGHRHCGSEDMFLVVEEQDFRCSCFNLPLLFSSKSHGFKAHVCHFNKSDPGQAHLKQRCKKNTQTTFASPSKSDRKEKEIEEKGIAKRKANAIKIQVKYCYFADAEITLIPTKFSIILII